MCNAPGTSGPGTGYSKNTGAEEAKRLLKEAGFNVDLRTSDCATVVQRRLTQAPAAQNGCSVVPLILNGIDLLNPLTGLMVSFNCLEGNRGRYWYPPMIDVLAGQFSGPQAYRSDIKDPVPFSALFRNMHRWAHRQTITLIPGEYTAQRTTDRPCRMAGSLER